MSSLLNQLVKFVDAHLESSKNLLNVLKNHEHFFKDKELIFVSLDAINLYPSIPILEAIDMVEDFASLHWDKIDDFGFNVCDLIEFLKLTSFNYEISYNSKTYLQIKGCPMGAHFSPPLAIIFMHKIEQRALEILKEQHNIKPLIYKRYIDDKIVGPFPKNDVSLPKILHTFNSINDNIQFTLDVPKNNFLNFLDVSIAINKKLSYKWFSKECHSGISLQKDSWLPSYVKNSMKYVSDRCSSRDELETSIPLMKHRLNSNGFYNTNCKIKDSKSNSKNGEKFVNLSLDFVNDKFCRKMKTLTNKFKLPIRITSKPGKVLANIPKRCSPTNACHCNVCSAVGPRFTCNDKYIVYNFNCKICNKNYIGQTCRPLKHRYAEHQRSLKNPDQRSALSEHVNKDHSNLTDVQIKNFDLSILSKQRNSVHTKLSESRHIAKNKPLLNRKHEMI